MSTVARGDHGSLLECAAYSEPFSARRGTSLSDVRVVRELGVCSTELRGIPHIERTRRRDVRRGMRTTKKASSKPVPSLPSALLRSPLICMIAFCSIPCCATHRQSHSEYAEHARTPSETKARRDRRPSVVRRPRAAPASVVCPPRSPCLPCCAAHCPQALSPVGTRARGA